MNRIDLNADLGEGEAADEALLDVVTSCNIACGGHTGDALSMARTVAAALARGVTVGAHPSYPDPEGFGRRSGFLDPEPLYAALTAQVGELAAIAADAGASTAHVKPHGALYHDAMSAPALADVVARVAAELPGDVAVVGPPGSELERAARRAGIRFVSEGFADRRYRADGTLVPRSEADAVMTSAAEAAAQAVSLACDGRVTAEDGTPVPLHVDTLCVHGDTPGAARTAAAIRAALTNAGVRIRAPARSGEHATDA